ncbi:S41 family peptidase [Stenotrophomonas mori]|uniref:S41 family peptidase n=1 Tax=Stenotrophomonas mori TaxID=2871096 RepID=A0ABT0SIT4_9GAMM|nr:S41 family peptidase [Stenotrophomonas mori]MCL7715248.1 S41 family peptidase [Stenotrophomonas mori]
MSPAPFLAALLAGLCPAQETVLQHMAEAVEQHYVDAPEARDIAASLREWKDHGRYADACGDWPGFALRLNRDLDAYDGHFHLERTDPDAPTGDDEWLMAWRSAGRPSNMGVREVRVLEGNVGYLRLTSFYPWDMAGAKLRNALELLTDTRALVIDLRRNGGGDTDTANQLVRALLDDGVQAVQDIQTRTQRRPDPLPAAALPAYRGRVAVLLDRRSASAAEFVAYSLQAEHRGTVVGTRSAGAATLLGDPRPLPHDFQVFIPEARPVNRRTGGNWDRDGVVPDAEGGDDPLHVARRLLERALEADTGDS